LSFDSGEVLDLLDSLYLQGKACIADCIPEFVLTAISHVVFPNLGSEREEIVIFLHFFFDMEAGRLETFHELRLSDNSIRDIEKRCGRIGLSARLIKAFPVNDSITHGAIHQRSYRTNAIIITVNDSV